jgi:hypothetical protein
MAIILTNPFSINMLSGAEPTALSFAPLGDSEAQHLARDAVSAVGHADTAALFAAQLGRPVPMNRCTVQLSVSDRLLVGQYSGPRLPEGATSLPDGATIRWWLVTPLGL